MDDTDLETDSVPLPAHSPCKVNDWDSKQLQKAHAKNSKYLNEEDRLESGYDSLRNGSLKSLNLGCDINDCRFVTDDEKLLSISDFQDLSIKNRFEPYIDEGCDLKSDLIEKTREDHNYVKYEDVELDDKNIVKWIEIEETFRQDEDGDTLLHTAIIQFLETLSIYYINLAPDIDYLNIINGYLQTPLHLAVITKQPLIVRKLITSGAQVDARDHNGNTPLHIAAKEGYAFIAQVLLEPVQYEELNGNKKHVPYQQIQFANTKKRNQQIPQNLEARNYDGQVCVHLAAEGGHLEILKVLLSKGADINARDGKSGRTILHYAAESGCMRLVKFLLKYPALNVNTPTYGGLTAFILASGRDHVEVVHVLKENGAVYELQDSDEEEDMNEECYDDIKINGNPLQKAL